jgi:serine/threonine protein kinase
MAEGLFDNRYRYDFIYPRGRSGETLRAVDTREADRPVVIKRPAPNDAPPIRAGQEVSILTERKALQKLAGQPSLCALLGSGQFTVGGVSHQYIVIERATGDIVADTVLALSSSGARMPELEMLVIVDALLGLLEAAHERDIVYNDVDAKHLFWSRDEYRLKVIDWGNAVFLEGDESSPQGISRQSDIYQVGELLYFIVTGGGRVEIPRASAQNATDDFRLDFSEDAGRLHTRLQAIISRATHPNPRYRYHTISEMRAELEEYRTPMERDRSASLNRVQDRLRRELSRDELYALLAILDPVLAHDPGHPPSRALEFEVNARISDLQVSADLDAARIYLESGSWERALNVLEELQPRARGSAAVVITILMDWAALLSEDDNASVQLPAVQEAISLLFEADPAEATRILVMDTDGDYRAQSLQWLMAERISAHVGEIMLLRPNLFRLQVALTTLAGQSVNVSDARAMLNEINAALDKLTGETSSTANDLRNGFRMVTDRLNNLMRALESVSAEYQLPNRMLPLSALTRATNAAMALADNMHVIGKQAATNPMEALGALDNSREIVAGAPAWEALAHKLDDLYQHLAEFESYVPAADGGDVAAWLQRAHTALVPFANGLTDERLNGIVAGLADAADAWKAYDQAAILGSRSSAIAALERVGAGVQTASPSLAAWVNQLRSVVSSAVHVERGALHQAVGQALSDGWEHFDRGRLPEAERMGAQAGELAANETEREAARRLHALAQHTREWIDRGGLGSTSAAQKALTQVELLYSAEEIGLRDAFAGQMPSKDTYLRAMNRGLIDPLERLGTAPVRIFFVNAVLYGALDAREGNTEDALFWRDVSAKTGVDPNAKHPLTRMLEDYVQQRRDLSTAAAQLGKINSAASLPLLDGIRRGLEQNSQTRLLAPAVLSVRELEAAVRDWTDGEFRSAGTRLENALKAVDEVEKTGDITLTGYRAWLMTLLSTAAELHSNARRLAQAVDAQPPTPPEVLSVAHQFQVEVTARTLGEAYTGTLRQWRDMYESFAAAFTDRSLRRTARLARLNELFGAMFIDRHPAYPLYRHWYTLTEYSPEFPAPPTDEPTPRISEQEEPGVVSARSMDDPAPPKSARGGAARSRRRISPILVLVLAIAIIAAVSVATQNRPGGEDVPTGTQVAAAASAEVTDEIGAQGVTTLDAGSIDTLVPTDDIALMTPTALSVLATIAPRDTDTPSPTFTATDTPTRTLPPSRTPTSTRTASSTPTQTNTPAPTLPPGGLRGEQDLLALAGQIVSPSWDPEAFSPVTAGSEIWRLGAGSALGEGDTLFAGPETAFLIGRYGEDAAARIIRMDAVLDLQTFNPPLVVDNAVYFGVLLQNADDPSQQVGVRVQIQGSQGELIQLSLQNGSTLTTVSQRARTDDPLRVEIVRNLTNDSIQVLVNRQPLGNPVPFVGDDVPVVPVLFVHNGGVIVYVEEWSLTLR